MRVRYKKGEIMFLLKNLFSFSWLFVGNIVPLQKNREEL